MRPSAEPAIHPRAASFLHAREKAARRGDANMVRAMNIELGRMGYVDPHLAEVVPVAATAVLDPLIDPKPKRAGRPKLPRCEHDAIAARCPICLGEVAEDEPLTDDPLGSQGDATGDFHPSDGLGAHSADAALREPENGREEVA